VSLTKDEQKLIAWTRLMAKAAGGGVYALLLEHGSLFTPPATPVSSTSAGTRGDCFRAASSSEWPDTVVVEGLAIRSDTGGIAIEHAWRATGSVALDPTWPDGLAYLGVAFVDTFRRRRQQQSGYWSLLWSPPGRDLIRQIPPDALAQTGRSLGSTLNSESAMLPQTTPDPAAVRT
jgi:hypothetical protein